MTSLRSDRGPSPAQSSAGLLLAMIEHSEQFGRNILVTAERNAFVSLFKAHEDRARWGTAMDALFLRATASASLVEELSRHETLDCQRHQWSTLETREAVDHLRLLYGFRPLLLQLLVDGEIEHRTRFVLQEQVEFVALRKGFWQIGLYLAEKVQGDAFNAMAEVLESQLHERDAIECDFLSGLQLLRKVFVDKADDIHRHVLDKQRKLAVEQAAAARDLRNLESTDRSNLLAAEATERSLLSAAFKEDMPLPPPPSPTPPRSRESSAAASTGQSELSNDDQEDEPVSAAAHASSPAKPKPYLGLEVSEESRAEGSGVAVKYDGLAVSAVKEPAATAGIAVSDIITHVNGKKVKSHADFRAAAAKCSVGGIVTIKLQRPVSGARFGKSTPRTVSFAAASREPTWTPAHRTIRTTIALRSLAQAARMAKATADASANNTPR